MAKLEDIKPGAKAQGVIPSSSAEIVSVEWIGEQAINVVFRGDNGNISETTLYRDDEYRLSLEEGGLNWSFEADGALLRLNLDLVVLILNDNSYGMIRWKQAGSGFEDWGLEYNNPDFVKYAESYGARGHRITSVNGFGETIDRAYREGGVHLIDMPVDYSQNVTELITDLRYHKPIVETVK